MSGITASTISYLWSVDDVLGQGATASVYKARHKVTTGWFYHLIVLTGKVIHISAAVIIEISACFSSSSSSFAQSNARMYDKKSCGFRDAVDC